MPAVIHTSGARGGVRRTVDQHSLALAAQPHWGMSINEPFLKEKQGGDSGGRGGTLMPFDGTEKDKAYRQGWMGSAKTPAHPQPQGDLNWKQGLCR